MLSFQDLSGDVAIKHKRPSRFHRRRPHNLMKEYLRRQAKTRWLRTHLWHAKRFHMRKIFGYLIRSEFDE